MQKPLHKREPVALVGAIAVVVVSAAAAFHVGLETDTVETLITDGILIVGAVVSRSKVSPTA